MYRKSVETHLQRGYTIEEMTRFLAEAGLKLLELEDADTGLEANENSERIHVVAMEQGKEI